MTPRFAAACISIVRQWRLQPEGTTLKEGGRAGLAGAIFVASCMLSLSAQATLGQNVSTVAGDAVWMHAITHTVSQRTGYVMHRLTLPSGTVVREFVSLRGVVFGVAWEGPTLPDLKATLGPAFDQYVAATATRRGSPLAVSTGDLLIFSTGHMRAFAGHAFLPLAVPAGVDIGVIQ
jgi:hypothetical protein